MSELAHRHQQGITHRSFNVIYVTTLIALGETSAKHLPRGTDRCVERPGKKSKGGMDYCFIFPRKSAQDHYYPSLMNKDHIRYVTDKRY